PKENGAQAQKYAQDIGTQSQKYSGAAQAGSAQAQSGPRQPSSDSAWAKRLEKLGYIILQDDYEAKEASNALSALIKEGKVKGVRAFDKRYYIASKDFYEYHRPTFLDKLEKSNYTPESIAKAVSVEPEAAMVMLALMSSEGEALEKRKGTYSHA
ncbi:MAG TPA: hypothetical protein PLO51_03190, partial [Candidatus Micrarchaeota archaeon]|nr:hypothetical protein [Candidatus Micrarchaeota archaeon]